MILCAIINCVFSNYFEVIILTEMQKYNIWLEKATEDADLQEELKEIKGNDEEIFERFYRELAFGTGGLRGVLGAGTNRLNIYTIRKATQGLANYINDSFKEPEIAIAYDSRIKSDVFAKEAAQVLSANGIKVHIYSELMPTPMLSYAVRALKCDAGIVVTASHNPAKYNGYKVYGNDGCQITLEAAEIVTSQIEEVDCFDDVKVANFDEMFDKGQITYIGQDIIESYYKEVIAQSINKDAIASSGLKIVYTPLNGTGNKPVREILSRVGIKDIVIVPEQEMPDGNFTTCPFPNPEITEALQLGLELSYKEKPDLLLATDPDCDRVGIAVKDGNDYVLFSGNEVGALLFEYISKNRKLQGTMPKDPIAVKTIVSTDIVSEMAQEYGVELLNVLTGFKFIGEQIGLLEEKGEEDRFIFGFEESYGYLAGTYVRDKDAVVASMLICEMAAHYRLNNSSLIQARDEMYRKYGAYNHQQESYTCEGASGMQRMAEIMQMLSEQYPDELAGLKIVSVDDYVKSQTISLLTGEKKAITLPKSDVLCFNLEGGASLIIRPSGTEPKIKIYYTTKGETLEEANALQKKLSSEFSQILGF